MNKPAGGDMDGQPGNATGGPVGKAPYQAPPEAGRSAFGFLFRGQPARFVSDYSVAESVERLKGAQRNPPPSRWRKEVVKGTVAADDVRLTRAPQGERNPMTPWFTGEFAVEQGRTVLTGAFAPSDGARLFLVCWFGMLLVFAGFGLRTVGFDSPAVWLGAGVMTVLFFFGWALMAIGRQMARPHIAWLSALIEQALKAPPADGTPS